MPYLFLRTQDIIMAYMVYILRCSDNTLYTGITNDLERRLKQHSTGNGSRYVRTRRPFSLVYTERAASRSDALKRELQIKALPRPEKLRMISGTIHP